MGPPSLNGGNEEALAQERAVQALQWGRRLSTAEIVSVVAAWTVEVTCFNGAAVSQRRKCRHAQAPEHAATAASMGPPSLNGGNHVTQRPQAHHSVASMGPPSLNGGNRVLTKVTID